MSRWVPILSQDHMGKVRGQAVDERDHRIAIGYGQAAAGTKIVLNIDQQQDIRCLEAKLVWKFRHIGFQ